MGLPMASRTGAGSIGRLFAVLFRLEYLQEPAGGGIGNFVAAHYNLGLSFSAGLSCYERNVRIGRKHRIGNS